MLERGKGNGQEEKEGNEKAYRVERPDNQCTDRLNRGNHTFHNR